MPEIETFRAETRAWLEANCPPSMREPVRDEEDVYWGGRNARFKSDAQRQWFEACRDKGYTVPAWPKEYGGGGLSPDEAKVLREVPAASGELPSLALSERGGGTTFPDVPLEVAPFKGNAVFFSYERAHPSTRTLHAGAPVLAGEKWVATKWLREGRFD